MPEPSKSETFDPREFVQRWYDASFDLAHRGVEALREFEVEDIEYELPFSERLPRFTGLEQHAKVIAALAENLTSYEAHITGFYPTPDPNTVIVEATGGGPTVRGGDYRNDYVQFITFRDGKIARIREYFNPTKNIRA